MGSDGAGLRLDLVPVTAAELPAWRDTWRDLESRADRPMLYTSFDWLYAWARVIGAPRLLLAHVVDADGESVAVALLESDRVRNLNFAGGDLTPTRRPLCAAGRSEETWATFSRWLHEHRRTWSTFATAGVDREVEALADVEIEAIDGTYLTLSGSFEDHLGALSERNRNEVRRRLRRTRDAGIELHRVPAEGIEAALEVFLSFHRARAEEVGIVSAIDERALELLRTATCGDAELEAVEVLAERACVAVGLNVVYRDVMFPYAIGWASDASSLAPGILLTIDTITSSLRRGLRAVDMGPGAQKYKLSLGFDLVPAYVARVANPSATGRSYRLLARIAAARRR